MSEWETINAHIYTSNRLRAHSLNRHIHTLKHTPMHTPDGLLLSSSFSPSCFSISVYFFSIPAHLCLPCSSYVLPSPICTFSFSFVNLSSAILLLYSVFPLPSIPCLQVTGPLLAVSAVVFSVCSLPASTLYNTVARLGCYSAFCKFRQPDI